MRRSGLATVLVLLGGCLGGIGSAQGQVWVSPRYVHEAWTTAEGLPVNAINDLLQAQDGYLWLATFDGLVRFDGVRFTVFTVSNTPGLPSNRIIRLYETAGGVLWVMTAPGHLVRFDGRAFHAAHPLEAPAPLQQDAAGRLWTGDRHGLYAVADGLRPVEVRPPAAATIQAVVQDRHGVLWVGTATGLHRYAAGTWDAVGTEGGSSAGSVLELYEDAAAPGTLWIGTQAGLYRTGAGSRSGPLAAVSGTEGLREVRALFRDGRGTLSGYSRDGYFTYEDGRVRWLRPEDVEAEDPYPKRGVAGERGGAQWVANGRRLYEDGRPVLETARPLTSVVRDHEGSLWIATSAEGLHRLRRSAFTTYGEAEGLASAIAYGLSAEADGSLWIATLDGWVARLREGRITNYTNGAVRTAWTVLARSDGTLWAGGPSGLWRCRPPARPGPMGCTAVPLRAGGQPTVRALYEDRAGTLWAGTTDGLYRLRAAAVDRFTTAEGLAHDRVQTFAEAADGSLWIATYGGMTRYRDEAGAARFESFTTAEGLSSDHVRAVYEDREGVLWVGTEDQGLNRIDVRGRARLQDAAVTVYREADGLFDEIIHALLDDGAGRFWMSTNRGLFWVHRADLDAFAEGRLDRLPVKAYDERDGMRSREGNGGVQSPALRTPDGRLWFATQGGVVVIDPRTVRPNAQAPPVAIEEAIVAGRPHPLRDGVLVLPPSVRDVDIAYTGLSFAAPEHMRFRYRLRGLNDQWTEVDRRTAFFTNVPPGRYTFEVTASNNDGVWNEAGAALAVVVEPRVYETGWFYGLVGLSVLLVLGLGYRRRMRQIGRRARELEHLVAERTATVAAQAEQLRRLDAFKSRFFANLSHEFRTPLTLIIGPLQRALAGEHGPLPPSFEPEGRIMLRNSQRLQRLINQILDLARLEDGSLRVEAGPHDLVPFVGEITEAFGPLADEQGIGLAFEPAQPSCVALYDPDLLEKVVLNLLSNAFKATEAGDRVTVGLDADADGAVIRVADTGPGIAAAALPHLFDRFYQVDGTTTRRQEGSGIGLALAKELVQALGGTLAVESEVGVGSMFTIRLPAATGPAARQAAAGPAVAPVAVDVLPEHTGGLAETTAPAGAEDEDRTTVLVVEDNADMRTYIAAVLDGRYRVLEAVDGADGLAQAQRHLPDLIVSDVMMPAMDGFALNRALKADPALDGIPVVLLTARAEAEDQVVGYETGADGYVTKPFEASVLRAQVQALLDTRLRLRARFRETPPDPPEPPPSETPFVRQARQVVEARLADPAFTMEDLAEGVYLSYVQCYRRLTDEAGVTPSEFVRTIRLERAAALLAEGAGSVSEVAYAVGFNSLSYFSRCFRAQFGATPSAYASGG